MNKERYNQIIDEAYENYSKEYEKDNSIGMCLLVARMDGKLFKCPTQEDFINQCKTDSEFSERWGLKIEERKLSLEERLELWYQKNKSETGKRGIWEIDYIEKYEGHKKLNSYNIPTKLITITYNNETIESYE
jgi:hypothetical protein